MNNMSTGDEKPTGSRPINEGASGGGWLVDVLAAAIAISIILAQVLFVVVG